MRLFAEKVVEYFEGRAHEDSLATSPRPPKESPKPKPPTEKALDALDEINKAAKKLTSAVPQDQASPAQQIAEALPLAVAALEGMKAEREQERRQFQEEVALLQDEMVLMTSLASLGIMTASFGHERINDATEVLNDAARLRKHIADPQRSLFSTEERLQMLDHLIAGAERVDAFAKFALDNVRPRKRKNLAVELKKVVANTIQVFDELLKGRYGTNVIASLQEGESFWVPGWEAGWESVLVNFITNACWALGKTPVADRHVRITLTGQGAEVVLEFEDSGIGLEAGTELDIFRPGVTTKRDEHNRLIGTGMGLTIVNSFVTRNRGTVKAVACSDLGGAKFEVRVPRLMEPAKK